MSGIAIRVLGGKSIGYGHFYRCISLSKAIRLLNSNIDILFIINDELSDMMRKFPFKFIVSESFEKDKEIINNHNIDLFILDSYLANNEYLRIIKELSQLMIIDDNNDIYDMSIPDIIYNGNIYADKLMYADIEGQVKLLGAGYLIMKEEYWEKKSYAIKKDGILVTTGGTDEYGISLNILKEIESLDVKIRFVIGPGYRKEYIREMEGYEREYIYVPNSLLGYIESSDIVITAGGSTVYEVLSQKVLPIVFSIADNQDNLCRFLECEGFIFLGKYPDINYSMVKRSILKSLDYKTDEKIFDLVDGKGAINVAKRLLSIVN